MKKFSTFFLSFFIVTHALWAQPVLSNPADNLWFLSGNNPISFSWGSVASATSYRIQVALGDATLTGTGGLTPAIHDVNTALVRTASYTLTPGLHYSWTVRSSIANTNYATRRNFAIRHNPPTLNAPANGVQVLTSDNFSWSSVTNADQYYIEISTSSTVNNQLAISHTDYGKFPTIVGGLNIGNSRSTTLANLNLTLAPGTYYWHARGGKGSLGGEFSEVRSFVIPTTCNPPTGLSAVDVTHGAFTAQWNRVSAANSYNFRYALSSSSYSGIDASGSSATNTTINSSVAACKEYKFSVQSVCANNATSNWSSDALTTLATYPAPTNLRTTSVTSTQVRLTWDGVVGGAPAYQITDCNGNILANGINVSFLTITNLTPATTYTFSVRARNQSAATCLSPFTSCISVTTESTIPEIPTWFRSQLLTGTTNTADLAWSIAVRNASYFIVYRSNNGANGTYTEVARVQHPNSLYADPNLPTGTYYYKVAACNALGCSQQSVASSAIVVQSAATFNLALASAMTFGATNLTVGQTYTFTTSIRNAGNAAWGGTLYLKINGANAVSQGSVSIAAGATTSVSLSYTPTATTIGNNLPAELFYQTGGAGAGPSISAGNYQNPITINIIAAATTCSGCVTWTGGTPPSSTNVYCLASNDLCQRGIIIANQNATTNTYKGILRKDLSVLVFKALFGSQTAATPADNFPVPFADMRAQFTGNEYWFKATKAMAYLQFADQVTPFDRTFVNFRPNDSIARINALKMIMEAWNVRPDPQDYTSAASFCDVQSQWKLYAYVQKAARLGIIVGNTVDCSCAGATQCFHPYDNMTRNQAFTIIYRLLNKLNTNGQVNAAIPDKPTATQLQTLTNYFIPGNFTLQNLAQTPGVEHANFNHYAKSSFSMGGRGLPLIFEHSYNSFLTEMPDDFFAGKDNSNTTIQTLAPLGMGWTHSYNSYILKVDGYNDETDGVLVATQNPKLLIAWSNGSFQSYDKVTNAYDTEGIYDELTQSTSGGNEFIRIKSKNQMTYEFVSTSALKFYYLNKITDRNGNGLQMVYDGSFGQLRRLVQVYEIYANGTSNETNRKLIFNYNGTSPYLSSVTDNSINRTIQFNVNTQTVNLESFTDAKSQTSNYFYDQNNTELGEHLLTRIQLPKGNMITNGYQQRKLLSTETNRNNQTNRQSKTAVNWQQNYNAANANQFTNSNVSVTQNSATLTTNYVHDNKRRIRSSVTPTTSVTVNAYSTGNNVLKPNDIRITGAGTNNGSSVSMSYDTKGNPLSVTRTYLEAGANRTLQETFTYNANNDVTSHTDARANTTTFEYADGKNLSKVTRPLNSVTQIMARNAFYQVTSMRNPEGIVTNYAFDDLNGNLSSVSIQGTTIQASATFDNASRIKSMTDPNGKITRVDYDPNDNVTKETDARNAETTYGYDANDNLLSITDALQQVTAFTYSDAEDFLKTETFGGHTKTFDYNEDGSLKSFVRGNRSFAYSYDAKGRLATDGQVTLTYDDRNRIATATYLNRVTTYFYDELDRMTAYEYNANGRTDRVEYSYDNNSNLQTIKYPNNRVVTYAYDALNRMTTVTDWNNRIVARYDYKLDGRMNVVTFANGVKTTYAYDNAGRVNGMTTKKATNETLTAYTFGLDNVGNHTSEQMTEPLLNTGLATLTTQSITNPAYSFNRMSQYGNRSFTHDGQGNISADNMNANTFDTYDNLTAVAGNNPMTAQYDAGGNRRNLNQNNVNTRYILDILGMSKVLMETDENSGAVRNYYIHGATGLICRIQPDATTTHYYHGDFRGSIVAMTDANQNITHQYAYDPFGSLLSSQEPAGDNNPFRYVGQHGVMHDAPNRTFMRARYYDPSVGRFISEDPIAAANLYPYADNNPISNIDPNGEVSIEALTYGLALLVVTSDDDKNLEVKLAAASNLLNDITWDKLSNDRIKHLDADLQEKATDFVNLYQLATGKTIRISQGCRTKKEQDNLYAQGREIDKSGKIIGKIVTNAKGGQSEHNYGLAFDVGEIFIVKKKQQFNSNLDWKVINTLSSVLGLEWGGNWKSFVDRPHLELKKAKKTWCK